MERDIELVGVDIVQTSSADAGETPTISASREADAVMGRGFTLPWPFIGAGSGPCFFMYHEPVHPPTHGETPQPAWARPFLALPIMPFLNRKQGKPRSMGVLLQPG